MFDKNQLASLMQQAKVMQQNFQKVQQEIASLEVTGLAAGGLVEVLLNGMHDLKRVKIQDKLLLDNDKEMLEDLIAAAVNDANRKLEELKAEKMKGVKGMENFGGSMLPF